MTQAEYFALLLFDCGYATSAQRKGWLKKRFGVEFPDELLATQSSIAIGMLEDEKASGASGGLAAPHGEVRKESDSLCTAVKRLGPASPFPSIQCECGEVWTQETHTVCPKCARWPVMIRWPMKVS